MPLWVNETERNPNLLSCEETCEFSGFFIYFSFSFLHDAIYLIRLANVRLCVRVAHTHPRLGSGLGLGLGLGLGAVQHSSMRLVRPWKRDKILSHLFNPIHLCLSKIKNKKKSHTLFLGKLIN